MSPLQPQDRRTRHIGRYLVISAVVAFFGSILINLVLTQYAHGIDPLSDKWRHVNNFAYYVKMTALVWVEIVLFVGVPWWIIESIVNRRRRARTTVPASSG
jgi:hypothetical protein